MAEFQLSMDRILTIDYAEEPFDGPTAIVGQPKTGKTWFLSTIPGNKLIQCDPKRGSYYRGCIRPEEPKTWEELMACLDALEKAWHKHSQLKYLTIDGLDFALTWADRVILNRANAGITNPDKWYYSVADMPYSTGYKQEEAYLQALVNKCLRIVENPIFAFHTKMSGKSERALSIYSGCASYVTSLCNVIGQTFLKSENTFAINFRPDPETLAGASNDALNEIFDAPNHYPTLLKLYRGWVALKEKAQEKERRKEVKANLKKAKAALPKLLGEEDAAEWLEQNQDLDDDSMYREICNIRDAKLSEMEA